MIVGWGGKGGMVILCLGLLLFDIESVVEVVRGDVFGWCLWLERGVNVMLGEVWGFLWLIFKMGELILLWIDLWLLFEVLELDGFNDLFLLVVWFVLSVVLCISLVRDVVWRFVVWFVGCGFDVDVWVRVDWGELFVGVDEKGKFESCCWCWEE